MELHIYNSKHELLRVSWGPVITLSSLRRHFELLIANKHYPRDLRIITSSNVEKLNFHLTKENMHQIAKWREEALHEYCSVSTAIYSVKPVPSAYINFFSEFFDSPKSCLKEFLSEESALGWLLGGLETKDLMEK